jgi:hypothetical protein
MRCIDLSGLNDEALARDALPLKENQTFSVRQYDPP